MKNLWSDTESDKFKDDLVTGLITEKGVILSPNTEKINHLFGSI